MNDNFVHLHSHDFFSTLDGLGSPLQYAKRAKELGMTHLAQTNHGNVDGVIKFQYACKQENIIPIFGSELFIVSDLHIKEKGEKRSHITLLVKNEEGWHNLLRLITISNIDGFYYRPRIDPETLLKYIKGLIVMSACSATFLHTEWGKDLFQKLYLYGEDTYYEQMPHLFEEQLETNKLCLKIQEITASKCVATNDAHYVLESDAKNHEVLLAIQTKAKMSDEKRYKFSTDGFYLKSYKEMVLGFREQGVLDNTQYKEALRNTIEIAEKCSGFIEIPKQKVMLPKADIESFRGRDDIEILKSLCEDGFKEKVITCGKDEKEYRKRLEEELELIIAKNFHRYFLISWELMKWCRDNDIMTSPARGSSASSLICYLLGITQVDPIVHNLIFARFLSKERFSLPDVDSDFEDVKRPLVRQHLEELYGKNNVAGVSTFGYMRGKSALRDVCRVFDVPLKDVSIGAAAITSKLKSDEDFEHSIQEGLENTDDGKWFYKKYPEVCDIAIAMEGTIRNRGCHASALIVANEDLTNSSKCSLVRVKDGEIITNWDGYDIEHNGLMKLDVLGLSMLSVLNYTKQLLKRRGIELDYNKLSLDDERCYEEISAGNTVGCFQIGTPGLRKFCNQLGVENFDMLVHATSLFRPGTMDTGQTELFVRRKRGLSAAPAQHPILEAITDWTFGIVVYQEQLMFIVHELAGLDWEIAEKLRKLMAKSQGAHTMMEYKEMFVRGCRKKKTIGREEAEELFDTLAALGSYIFNQCLTGDTVLYRTGPGKNGASAEITIEKLYEIWNSNTPTGFKYRGKKGLLIRQLKEDGRVRMGKIKGVVQNGVKPVFKITIESGRAIKATANHRFLMANGKYQYLTYLKIGDELCSMGERERLVKRSGIPQFRGHNTAYDGCGFKEGNGNIGYVDGRYIFLKKAQKLVFDRSKGLCEQCGKTIYHFCKECGHLVKNGKPEFAHIKSLEDLNYDFSKYHNEDNLKMMCNSCHKSFDYGKGERKIVNSVGRPILKEKIISIESVGDEMTYDIEMEDPDHNFIANGFVSHNSHAVSYSYISYWNIYVKTYYPVEYMCALLTYGCSGSGERAKEKKNEYVEEASRMNIDLRPPKIGISEPLQWIIRDGALYAPFIEINGVGDKTAAAFKKIGKDGFFKKEGKERAVGKKFMEILKEIKAYDDEALTNEQALVINKYFNISFIKPRRIR